jgi:hypothetical protein
MTVPIPNPINVYNGRLSNCSGVSNQKPIPVGMTTLKATYHPTVKRNHKGFSQVLFFESSGELCLTILIFIPDFINDFENILLILPLNRRVLNY